MRNPHKITPFQKMAFYSTLNDGIEELNQAVLLFLACFLPINQWTPYVFTGLIFLTLICQKFLHQKIKCKFIYPRIGFVKFSDSIMRKTRIYRKITIVIITILVISYVCIAFLSGKTINETLAGFPLIMGIIFSLNMIYFYVFTSHFYYLVLAGVNLLIGCILIFFIPFEGKYKLIVFSGFLFLELLGIGLGKIMKFYRNNPIMLENE